MARTNRRHTFTVTRDLYEEISGEDGTTTYRCVKKNVKLEIDLYLNDIKSVSEVCSPKGKVLNDRCEIFHDGKGELVVMGTKKDISAIIFGKLPEDSEIGFKQIDK